MISNNNLINRISPKLYSLLAVFMLITLTLSAQNTYKSGSTEYYYNQYYSTTGKPKVKRSSANKQAFLNSKGYSKVPNGYEVDHIVPLSEGGSDDPSNMQLLTIEQHDRKTAKERARNSNSTYSDSNSYYSTSTRPTDSYRYVDGKKIYTGKNGGKYYINRNGNKSYISSKSKSSSSYSSYSSSSSSYSSKCGARNKTGGYCKRTVKGGGRCYSHK